MLKKWESEQETYGLNVQKSQSLLIDHILGLCKNDKKL